MILVSLIVAIAVAGISALSALLTGATFTNALAIYAFSGMLTMLGLPLLLKSVALVSGILGHARAAEGETELRLIAYHRDGRSF